MLIIDVLYLVLIWGVPILLIWNFLRKAEKEKRLSLIKEIKHPVFIFGYAPMLIGLQLFLSGSVPIINYLKLIGLGLVLLGWIVICVVDVIKREKSLIYSIAMVGIGVAVFVAYFTWA